MDNAASLCDAVRDAYGSATPLRIEGGKSKAHFLGEPCDALPLSIAEHRGIVSYRPEELIVTARAGTPVAELYDVVAEQGQCLPFEPASLDGCATLGGALASGLSGPARPWRGSMRDAVLGVRLINGMGEHLRFGGEVIKNVAGYDVSRLQAGALGTLGVITEVSLKLLPSPVARVQLQRKASADESIAIMRAISRQPIPLTGLCWHDDAVHARIEGSSAAVTESRRRLTEFAEASQSPWPAIREWQLPGVSLADTFWGIDVAPATPVNDAGPATLIDWGGARRFLTRPPAAGAVGIVTRYGSACATRSQSLSPSPALVPALQSLRDNLKRAMDPAGIFNPGRLGSGC